MTDVFHTDLEDRWSSFSLIEQMANIGAEVGRCMSWKKRGNSEMSRNALYRCLELIDFTIADKKNKHALKEILRVREALVDYFLGDNIYKSSDVLWDKYFYFFNFAARNT